MSAKDDMTLLVIKGAISDLSEEDRAKVKDAAEKLRTIVAEGGDFGALALALVGAEMAAQVEG